MHRTALLAVIERYLERFPEDRVRADHVRQFVRQHSDCFERTCVEGHVTGSAWILSHDQSQVLLLHHRKLDRWLQPGGHSDGDTNPERVARREAEEETGLANLILPPQLESLPLDIDVHIIPARGAEAAHLHHDIRYLLIDPEGRQPVLSHESNEVRWIDRDALPQFTTEESVLRMERKTRDLFGA